MEKIRVEYTNPSLPGSFAGKSAFVRELKKRHQKVDLGDIEEFLADEETYTLHRPSRKRFRRNQIIVAGKDDTFQADLIDVSNIKSYNDDNKFILTCIDVFSKYAWAIPIQRKSALDVLEAFKLIFKDGRIPNRIQTDEGNEFLNKILKRYFDALKIKIYFLNSEMKAAIVERFNRTLKEKMWRYFTHKQSFRYIDVLKSLLVSYNNSYHRTIKTTPLSVNEQNEDSIWQTVYGHPKQTADESAVKFKFKVGDLVRISKAKGVFAKGYTANWTREIFKINACLPRKPPVYRLMDRHPTKP